MGVQRKKCLIIDEMHPSIVPLLEGLGFDVIYRPQIEQEEVYPQLEDCYCLVIRSKVNVDEKLLSYTNELRYIVRAGAGIDNLEVESIISKGIKIINAPEGNRDALAEHAIGMLLALFNNITKSSREIGQGTWDREGNRGVELMGKTVGLIGYGHMGKAFSKRLSSFGCEVLAFDKYKQGFPSKYAKEVPMEDLFGRAEVLSLHVPLTPETKAMVDESFLNRFTNNIYLLNTARGGILSIRALVKGLQKGKVLGAALDVLENEKLATLTKEQKMDLAFLSQSDQVILTPHVAGWTYESYRKINKVLIEKLKNELVKF